MVTREDMVTQSVQGFLRDKLYGERDYPEARVEMLDEFPFNRFEGPLDKTYVAFGFDFDSDQTPAEMGSDLVRRTYTIEIFVFGHTALWGKNVANVCKFILEDGMIPLHDVGTPGQPQIDVLPVVTVNSQRQPIPNPKPFQENCYLVTAKVDDEYHAGLA